jgi:hypothetical protein
MALYLSAKKRLAHAYETKKLVKKYLSDVALLDTKMKKQNTAEIFASRYSDFQDDYKDLIKTIDEGEVSDALEDKKEVITKAKDLYGDAVVYRNINKAKRIMDKIEEDNLDEAVPKHYEKLQEKYEKTRLQIKREPDNIEKIKKISQALNEYAAYTLTLGKEVVKLKSVGEDDEYERYLDRIHHQIASLNKNEKEHSVLPLSLEEKILYLKDQEANALLNTHKISTAVPNKEATPEKSIPQTIEVPNAEQEQVVTPVVAEETTVQETPADTQNTIQEQETIPNEETTVPNEETTVSNEEVVTPQETTPAQETPTPNEETTVEQVATPSTIENPVQEASPVQKAAQEAATQVQQ